MKCYDIPGGEDSEFEPGSGGKVLRNLLGVTDVRLMELLESRYLVTAQERFYEKFENEHRFTFRDLRDMHREWLGPIYPFAGTIRTVNIGKGGFQFATVQFLESNLKVFERDFLQALTPCRPSSLRGLSDALAKVHGEFIMLHPFREGNGRLGRWLADVMAAQAGLPFPSYGFTEKDNSGRRVQYLSAVKKAALTNYEDLSRFFYEALLRGLEEA